MKMLPPGPVLRSIFIGSMVSAGISGCSNAGSGPHYADSASPSATAVSATASRAFPVGLAVASPFASGQNQSGSSQSAHKLAPSGEPTSGTSYSAKSETLSRVLNGTTLEECLVTLNLNNAAFGNSSCFGPALSYKNHPEDPDASADEKSSGGGDSGIWAATDDVNGEACVATQVNATVQSISNQVDSGTLIAASMLCVANVSGAALPAEDETLDLTAAMQEAYAADDSFDVTSAALAREGNTTEGFPIYVSTLELSTVDFDGSPRVAELRLKHIPLDDDNSTYQGKLSMAVRTDNGQQQGNCGEAGDGSVTGGTAAFSISYTQESGGIIRYRLDSSNFCGVDAEPFVSASNYSVDVDDVLSAGNAHGHDGYFIARVEIETSTGAGDYQFARQMGANDANTRTLAAHLEVQDGVQIGRGYFGYGPSVYEDGVGEIDGMTCNWGLPSDVGTTFVEYAQSQELVFADGIQRFVPAEEGNHFAYAPTSTCSHVVEAGVTSDFRFWAQSIESEEEARGATSVTHEMVGIDEVDVVIPTDPVDVDDD